MLITECQNTWGKTDRTAGALDEFAIIFEEFNTLLSVEDRYSREKSVRM